MMKEDQQYVEDKKNQDWQQAKEDIKKFETEIELINKWKDEDIIRSINATIGIANRNIKLLRDKIEIINGYIS